MAFVKDPEAHKALIEAVLAGREYDQDAWLALHLNRNEYNVRRVDYLRHINGNRYTDNAGRIWTELSTFKNFFHMPKGNWALSQITGGLVEAYSRKFLSPDDESGLGGEYEMIIRSSDGKRIDALTNEGYQETYNFGRTENASRHKRLDVDPHGPHPNYLFRRNMGYTEIRE